MASNAEVLAIVAAMKQCAESAKALKTMVDQALGNNSAHAIDWGQLATSHASLIDAAGDITGHDVTPAEVSNLIGSLDNFRAAWWVTSGHGGNVEKLTKPIV